MIAEKTLKVDMVTEQYDLRGLNTALVEYRKYLGGAVQLIIQAWHSA